MDHHRTKLATSDERSSPDLIERALVAEDEDERWNFVSILHARGSEIEFQTASALCSSSEAARRALGADILGQLGWGDDTFLVESVEILIRLLADSSEPVIESAVFALGHRREVSAVPDLLELVDHSDENIRHAVAYALGGFDDDRAIGGLIQLSTDSDDDVRNWATFGLGTQTDVDTPAIREALAERLTEMDHEIRGEALVGLAKRKHPESLQWVRWELGRDSTSILALEAAQELSDPELYPILLQIKKNLSDIDDEYFLSHLDDALQACRPGSLGDET